MRNLALALFLIAASATAQVVGVGCTASGCVSTLPWTFPMISLTGGTVPSGGTNNLYLWQYTPATNSIAMFPYTPSSGGPPGATGPPGPTGATGPMGPPGPSGGGGSSIAKYPVSIPALAAWATFGQNPPITIKVASATVGTAKKAGSVCVISGNGIPGSVFTQMFCYASGVNKINFVIYNASPNPIPAFTATIGVQ